MKRTIWLSSLLVILLVAINTLVKEEVKDNAQPMPQPTDTTVKMDMEEGNKKVERKKWFDLLHQAEEGVDWRQIEYETAMEKHKVKSKLRKESNVRGEDEWVADGNILGQWNERGSYDQAGSVLVTEYDKEEDKIYTVSAGGTLWQGTRDGFGWKVINQDFRFSNHYLHVIYREDGSRRILAAIQNTPHYSDDDGATWTKAEDISSLDGAFIGRSYVIDNNGKREIIVLHKRSYWASMTLYKSLDDGESFKSFRLFGTSDTRNIAVDKNHNTDDLYVIEQISGSRSSIHKYNKETNKLQIIVESSPLGFGEDGRANLEVVQINDSLVRFYAYNDNSALYTSEDEGVTWQYKSLMDDPDTSIDPIKPWQVGLFVSKKDPDVILVGAVEALRSSSGGEYWKLINRWWDYYDQVSTKLHADMMYFNEFETKEGESFILISNHGGLSISYDGAETNTNIGEYGLNVSQYYSVATLPSDPKWVFAGSQDQGFQRGIFSGNDVESLYQVISGDYGHIVFTGNGENLWTVYPFGWVTYYENPISGGITESWEVDSDQESVWIPPLLAGPDADKDLIYMAGGNVNGGPGSHVMILEWKNGFIDASQFPFNFASSGGEVSAMNFSPFNPDIFYVATTNGRFYKSTDGGQNFTPRPYNLPGSHYLYGSCILPSKVDPMTIYLSGSGYSTAPVVRSIDGGHTWEEMNEGMPPTTAFCIRANEDESLIFAATEAGPYVYIASHERWFDLSGLAAPNQTYWSVEYLEDENIARFGTYGRGIWDFEVKQLATATEDISKEVAEVKLFPNPVDNFLNVEIKEETREVYDLKIYDQLGRLVYQDIIRNISYTRIDLRDLQSGQFFIKLESETKQYASSFIKT